MKNLLQNLDKTNKGLKYRIFGAIQRGEIDGWKNIGTPDGVKAYSEEE
jgi:hypothetical protein